MESERPHDARSAAASSPGAPGLTLGEISALLGLPPPTIRSWERRHALPTGATDADGHRRYSHADVAVLLRMRDLRAAGLRVHQAVAAATSEAPLVLCQLLLAAVDLLDRDKIAAVLDSSLDAHGLPVTLDEVLLPSMREVGARWWRGECDVAQEQLVSDTVLAWLAGRAAAAPPPLHELPIVLSCGPQDQHTIALEAFDVLLREQRFDCHNLGAQTPAASLRLVVERCSAQAVVLACHLPRNRLAATTALQGLSNSGAALFYAGAAFRTSASRSRIPGHYLGGNLAKAAAHVTTQLRPG